MKLRTWLCVIGLSILPTLVDAQSTANVTFLQDGNYTPPTGPVPINMFLLRINAYTSSQWTFGQTGTTIRILCIDPRNTAGNGMTWNARVNFLSNANYQETRRGHLSDAEVRYKKVAYLYSKLPAMTPQENTNIMNVIYYFLNERVDATVVQDTALINETNTWYRAGAYGIDWSQVAIITDNSTLISVPGDTNPPRGGTQEFISFATKQTPLTLSWTRGKQLLLVADSVKSPLTERSTVRFTAYARTSSGTPVTTPLVTWELLDSTSARVDALTNKSMMLTVAPTLTKEVNEVLVGSWTTRSGVFKDTVSLRFTPMNYLLPWQPRQQVLVTKSTDQDLFVNANPMNTSLTTNLLLTGYARTSSGVPVTNPRIVYTTTSPFIAIRSINNTTAQVTVVKSPTEPYTMNSTNRFPVEVTATWNTSSGPLSTKITLYISTYQ
jgi:hypothetical protein